MSKDYLCTGCKSVHNFESQAHFLLPQFFTPKMTGISVECDAVIYLYHIFSHLQIEVYQNKAVFFAPRNPRFSGIINCCCWVCTGGETAKNIFLWILAGIRSRKTGLVHHWIPEEKLNPISRNIYLFFKTWHYLIFFDLIFMSNVKITDTIKYYQMYYQI